MARGSGVKKIGDLFEKYKNKLQAPQATVVNGFIEVVEKEFDYHIQKHLCTYSPHSKTISLSISGPVKTEILLNQNLILTELSKKIGEKNTPKQIL